MKKETAPSVFFYAVSNFLLSLIFRSQKYQLIDRQANKKKPWSSVEKEIEPIQHFHPDSSTHYPAYLPPNMWFREKR